MCCWRCVEDDDSWNTGYACEGSELQIRCAEGTVIHVINANYGRLDAGICNDFDNSQEWNLRCVTRESLDIVRERSSSMFLFITFYYYYAFLTANNVFKREIR